MYIRGLIPGNSTELAEAVPIESWGDIIGIKHDFLCDPQSVRGSSRC